MLKLAGALILMAGASSIGFGAAAQLRARVTSLRALIGGLELMERELSFRLTPMPDLLAVVAKRAQAPACYFFARCRDSLDRLGEKSLGELWREALQEPGKPAPRQSLEIADLLQGLEGWERGSGNRRFSGYGVQKYWVKRTRDLLPEVIE